MAVRLYGYVSLWLYVPGNLLEKFQCHFQQGRHYYVFGLCIETGTNGRHINLPGAIDCCWVQAFKRMWWSESRLQTCISYSAACAALIRTVIFTDMFIRSEFYILQIAIRATYFQ